MRFEKTRHKLLKLNFRTSGRAVNLVLTLDGVRQSIFRKYHAVADYTYIFFLGRNNARHGTTLTKVVTPLSKRRRASKRRDSFAPRGQSARRPHSRHATASCSVAAWIYSSIAGCNTFYRVRKFAIAHKN